MRIPARTIVLLATLALCAGSVDSLAAEGRCALPLVSQYVKMPPAARRPARAIRSLAAPAQQREFWTWDLSVMPPGFRRIPVTLRAQGASSAVYVEDAEWGRTVDQAAVDRVLATFESRTPSHPERGIASIDQEAFAPLPAGLDGETRVTILFAKLGKWHGQGFDGFFNSFDTYSEAEAWSTFQQHSNETNIIYLNTDGSPPSSDYMLAVVAHELVHLLAHPADPEEAGWVGESLGEAGMLLCGYDTDQAHALHYASRPSTPLVTEPYVSYGACLMFAAHLLEHEPRGFVRRLTAESAQGIEGVEKTLASYGSTGGFGGLLERWIAVNYAAGAGSTSPEFSYATMKAPAMAATAISSAAVDVAGKMQATGVTYLRFDVAGSYELTIASQGPAPLNALQIHSPATDRTTIEQLSPAAGSQMISIEAAAGDCVAIYGLAPGVYTYRVSVRRG